MRQERAEVMNKNTKKSDIKSSVMSQIDSGVINMKPRIYFTLLWLIGILASVGAGILFAYILNMLAFVVRIQFSQTPSYGARQNLENAIETFPWWALILLIILIIISFYLMRKYSRAYRYKFSLIVVVFLALSVLLGIAMSYLSIGHSQGQGGRYNYNQQYDRGEDGRGNEFRRQEK